MTENEPFAEYMPHIRQRWLQEQAAWETRRHYAWAAARRAATLLRDRYGAEKILAFGSLVRSGPFDVRSDVDLAVAGIPPASFFRAYAQAMIVVGEFELDIVDLDDCSPSLREQILKEGVPL